MYEIVLGALRKMNQDNDFLFNANLMNELRHDYVSHDYDYVMFMLMIEPMYDYV